MAAFDRVMSGIPEMDEALDNIRLGDNVVFRVSELSEFKLFVDPYIEQAKKDKRNIIYFRFATHEPPCRSSSLLISEMGSPILFAVSSTISLSKNSMPSSLDIC